MHQDFAEQATGQMPQVAGPDPLAGTALDELANGLLVLPSSSHLEPATQVVLSE
jgi:hypothetical protein